MKSHLNYEKEAFITLVASHFVKLCQEERPNQNEYNIHTGNHKKSDKSDAHFSNNTKPLYKDHRILMRNHMCRIPKTWELRSA